MKLVGTWWLPDEERHLAEWITARGDYQTAHRKNALNHVTKWRVAIDCGAHVGLWSREFAAKFGTVHAFEPVAAHRECFVKNVPAENVVLYPVALGAANALVKMTGVAHSTGGTHVDPDASSGDIPCIMIDALCFPVVDFIKIDCEGYESYILSGALKTLERCKPVVCIEQKNTATEFFGLPRYAARDLLLSIGMKELSRVVDDIVLGW